MKAIVAITEDMVIGSDGGLVKTSSDDFKMFRNYTMGKTVVGGRKTFEEIGRPLEGRRNIMLTRATNVAKTPYLEVFNNKEDVLELGDDIVIIGGAEIYKLFKNEINELLVTYWREPSGKTENLTYFPLELLDGMEAVKIDGFPDRVVVKYRREANE